MDEHLCERCGHKPELHKLPGSTGIIGCHVARFLARRALEVMLLNRKMYEVW